MKEEYETKVFVDESVDDDEGWEIVDEKVEKIKSGIFSERLITVTKVRRKITPVKLRLNLNITLPKWRTEKKELSTYEISNEVDKELQKLGYKT